MNNYRYMEPGSRGSAADWTARPPQGRPIYNGPPAPLPGQTWPEGWCAPCADAGRYHFAADCPASADVAGVVGQGETDEDSAAQLGLV